MFRNILIYAACYISERKSYLQTPALHTAVGHLVFTLNFKPQLHTDDGVLSKDKLRVISTNHQSSDYWTTASMPQCQICLITFLSLDWYLMI